MATRAKWIAHFAKTMGEHGGIGGAVGQAVAGDPMGAVKNLGKAAAITVGTAAGASGLYWVGKKLAPFAKRAFRPVGEFVGGAYNKVFRRGACAASTIGRLTGFSQAEQQMIRRAEKALSDAGYDVSLIRELIRADLPAGHRGMTLEGGAALGEEAFSSQPMLNHVLEEELRHLQQKAAGLASEFCPGTAKSLEEAADAGRKFPLPK